jgi:hypothetical protein
MYKIDLPISVQIGKNKRFSLNLNQYRNTHFRDLDKAKKQFKEDVTPLIRHLPFMERVRLSYTLFTPSRQLVDTANVVAIVDKFFCDALVETGKLSDDNCLVVDQGGQSFGGVDKGRPRVEVTIEPTRELPGSVDVQPAVTTGSAQPEERSMQLKLVQTEIESALRAYINSIFTLGEGARIDMTLSATRGDDGFVAMVDIVPINHPQPAAQLAPAAAPPVKPLAFGQKTEAPAEVPAAAAPKAVAAKPPVQRVAPEPKPAPVVEPEPEVQEVVEPVAELVEEVVEEAVPAIRATPENRQPVEEDLEVSAAERPLKPSIFSNLNKPVNAPKATADAE